jgi:alpha/beta superfamily hydrolase
MQLLMRRPEIEGFVSVAPPANMYDFTFLAPCPSSGIIVQGTDDDVVPEPSVEKFVNKLKMQKNISIDYSLVKGANHFFKDQLEQLGKVIEGYLGSRLENPGISRRKPSPAAAAAAAGQ